MVSYGESNPVCTAHTKECWSQNRRVNFKLLP
jgi:peptidoglycan-associated lipoprotein